MPVPVFTVGMMVELKKKHPCGNDRFKITRTGADIGCVCMQCGRMLLLPRLLFEKAVRKVLIGTESDGEDKKIKR